LSFLQPSRVIVGVGDIEDGVRPLAWALTEARRDDDLLGLGAGRGGLSGLFGQA
jgi:hypothetical protein